MTPAGRPSRAAIHERLEAQVAELKTRLGGLPLPDEAEQIWNEIWHHEAHHSTALEGNTLVLSQVEQLLAEGKAVGSKDLKEYLEVTGYAKAAQWVYAEALRPRAQANLPLLTLQEVRHVHHEVMSDVWAVAPHPNASVDESPGNWRRHDIHPFPSGMEPPTFPLVPSEMASWVSAAAALGAEVEPIAERVGALHAAFERIHPFIDGNGRTGRLLANLVLVRLGYPPAIIYKRQRAQYLKALARADSGDPAPIGEIWARAILDNLMRFVLPAVAGNVKLLPLEALTGSGLSVVALRHAARRGALTAKRQANGEWLSSKKWADEYLKSRWKGLRKETQPAAAAVPATVPIRRLRQASAQGAQANRHTAGRRART